ncbi:MAG: cytochrome C oxidase subunit IV family protein [Tepidisphaeraceae bacterium]
MSQPLRDIETSPSPGTNFMVLVALMVLLAITIGLSFVDIDRYLPGRGWSTIAALTIAAAKAGLVLAYFMHLKYGNRLSILFAAAGFTWLAILGVYLLAEVAIG